MICFCHSVSCLVSCAWSVSFFGFLIQVFAPGFPALFHLPFVLMLFSWAADFEPSQSASSWLVPHFLCSCSGFTPGFFYFLMLRLFNAFGAIFIQWCGTPLLKFPLFAINVFNGLDGTFQSSQIPPAGINWVALTPFGSLFRFITFFPAGTLPFSLQYILRQPTCQQAVFPRSFPSSFLISHCSGSSPYVFVLLLSISLEVVDSV